MNEKRCRSCQHVEVNYMTDEMYCTMADGEEIRLGWHKHRPNWCPLLSKDEKTIRKKGPRKNGPKAEGQLSG